MEKIELLKKILNNCKKLDGWKINLQSSEKNNLYCSKQFEKESHLMSKRINVEVTIYKKFEKQLGDATFSMLVDEITEDAINQKITEQLIVCEHAKKEHYSLPQQENFSEEYKTVNLYDPIFDDQLKVKQKIEELFMETKENLKKHSNVFLNGLEFLTEKVNSIVFNSNGVNLEQNKSHIHIECVITAKRKAKENEFLFELDVIHFNEINIPEIIKENAAMVNDILKAESPKTATGNIILTKKAIKEFFAPHLSLTPIIAHASARLKHMDLSVYKKDFPIIEKIKGNKLTIISNPLLDNNPASQLFDGDGVLSKKIVLIENNLFKNYFAANRYAQYLNIQPTGALGTIEITPGKTSEQELFSEKECYEIVSFASFVPNYISGDFSAEIRLGYVIKNNNGKITKKPFRGGMFTGNIFTLLQNITLSKETMVSDGYYGPKTVRFNEAMIAGL